MNPPQRQVSKLMLFVLDIVLAKCSRESRDPGTLLVPTI